MAAVGQIHDPASQLVSIVKLVKDRIRLGEMNVPHTEPDVASFQLLLGGGNHTQSLEAMRPRTQSADRTREIARAIPQASWPACDAAGNDRDGESPRIREAGTIVPTSHERAGKKVQNLS
jgi:hypothetical protein